MPTITEVLSDRTTACLECLVTHTRLRADAVINEINALPLQFVEGRCGWCTAVGPVVAHRH